MQCHGPNTFYCAFNRNKISFGKWPFSAIRILDLIIIILYSLIHSINSHNFRQGFKKIYFWYFCFLLTKKGRKHQEENVALLAKPSLRIILFSMLKCNVANQCWIALICFYFSDEHKLKPINGIHLPIYLVEPSPANPLLFMNIYSEHKKTCNKTEALRNNKFPSYFSV